MNEKLDQLRIYDAEIARYNAVQPEQVNELAMKWDGEWHITIEVFRDLGLAFAAVLVLIYVLMVGWFRSFLTPIMVMVAIPFSLVGILPAHDHERVLVDVIELRKRMGMVFQKSNPFPKINQPAIHSSRNNAPASAARIPTCEPVIPKYLFERVMDPPDRG